MNITVRYYSRSGNTKAVADAIAHACNTPAVSVDAVNASLNEPADLLFIGGALYAYGLDSHLKAYLKTLNKDMVKKAAVFSTSWISKHSIDLIVRALKEAGIEVIDETFYVKNRPDASQIEAAKAFAKKYAQAV